MLKKLVGYFKKNTDQGEQVGLYGVDNLNKDQVGYPPEEHGLPVCQVGFQISRFNDDIKFMRTNLGIRPEHFDEFILPVIHNFIAYADMLPASQYKHHSKGGGLAFHSLDVAKRAIFQAQKTHFPVGRGTMADSQLSNDQWKSGTVLAALLHDGGKIVADLIVTNGEEGKNKIVWDEDEATINQWAKKNGLTRYYVSWRKLRHQKHKNASITIMERLIPQKTWSWLKSCYDGKDIQTAMLNAVLGVDIEHPMSRIVAECDADSTRADMITRSSHISREPIPIPMSELLLDLMKHRIFTNQWQINTRNSPVWYVNKKLYIVWINALPELLQDMNDMNYSIPDAPDVVAKVMIEEGAALASEDGLYADVYPEVLGEPKKPIRIRCLQIRYLESIIIEPSKIYSINEHPRKEKEKEPSKSESDNKASSVETTTEIELSHIHQKRFESASDSMLRVLGLMQKTESDQVVQNEQPRDNATETKNNVAVESESTSESEVIETDNINSNSLTSPIAIFLKEKFDFPIEDGVLQIPKDEKQNVLVALEQSKDKGLEHITSMRAAFELKKTTEVKVS